MTRTWLNQHHIQDAAELITKNEEFETKIEKLEQENQTQKNLFEDLQKNYEKLNNQLRNNNYQSSGNNMYLEVVSVKNLKGKFHLNGP